jgi:dTDP-glucose 4,6-dehydratase
MWWRKGSQVRSTISAVGEKANIDDVKGILQVLGKPESLITFVKDRPSHDWRYALDTTKIGAEVGCRPIVSFEEGLARTVNWYLVSGQ